MRTDSEKLDKILEHLEFHSQLLKAAIPAHKLPAKLRKQQLAAVTPEEVLEARMTEMERIFKAAGVDSGDLTKKSQNYPLPIIQGFDVKGWAIVPRSILLNRAAQGRLFAPRFDDHEISSMNNAVITLNALEERGRVVVAKPCDGNKGVATKALCVFSWDEALWWGLVEPTPRPYEDPNEYADREEDEAIGFPKVKSVHESTERPDDLPGPYGRCEECGDDLNEEKICVECKREEEQAAEQAKNMKWVSKSEEETFIKKKL